MLSRYKCWVFDCDGVLLNSNGVKSDAIYRTALPYGKAAASRLLRYHKEHGGVSRFIKFEYLFTRILKRQDFREDLDAALEQFSTYCRDGLRTSGEAEGLRDILDAIKSVGGTSFVVSGGMQTELREIFTERGLDKYFQGIFGSPDRKEDILSRELACGTMKRPAVFVGDSRYDYEAANEHGLDFIFASGWSEFDDWRSFFSGKPVRIISSVDEIAKSKKSSWKA